LKKRVYIFAPLSKYGGREIETGFIAHLLKSKYYVSLVSLGNYFKDSDSETLGKINYFTSLNKEVYESNFLIRVLISLMHIYKKKNIPNHFKVSNRFIKKVFNTHGLKLKIINSYIKKADLVVVCAQLDSNYVKQLVELANKYKKPIIFRTTGTNKIYSKQLEQYGWCNKVSLFLHHSEANTQNLHMYINAPYQIIDQCAVYENKLLKIPKRINKIHNFLILSRLAPEKRIDTVINAFNKFSEKEDKLFIFGKGEESENLKKIANRDNIEFKGVLPNKELDKVFNSVDCLIISSSEETGPLSAIESMASGVIIISTKVGAMTERLNNYDFWYDGSKEDLVRVLKDVKQLSAEEVEKNSEMLKNRYIEKFSLNKLSTEYLKVVENVIEMKLE
jgi:glycosyltransferase involved in cell wall biosynthesis